MKVININGTSNTKCKCGSWMKHWEKFSKSKAKYCSEKSCLKTKLEGAHVQKAGSTDQKWYIVPLCGDHNKKNDGEMELFKSTKLVSASKKETCEKSS